MALSGQILLKVNSTTIPKLKKYNPQISKLWKDAGRNMKGELKSVFIGNFLKLKIEISPTTEAEMSTLIALFKLANLTVEWYDEDTDAVVTTTMYPADFDYEVLSKDRGLYEPFSINLIATKKL